MGTLKETNINVRISSDLVQWLQEYAKTHGDISVSSIVRLALADFMRIHS